MNHIDLICVTFHKYTEYKDSNQSVCIINDDLWSIVRDEVTMMSVIKHSL